MQKPEVIASLILKSITVQKPKTRHYGGSMAGTLLFLKKGIDRQLA